MAVTKNAVPPSPVSHLRSGESLKVVQYLEKKTTLPKSKIHTYSRVLEELTKIRNLGDKANVAKSLDRALFEGRVARNGGIGPDTLEREYTLQDFVGDALCGFSLGVYSYERIRTREELVDHLETALGHYRKLFQFDVPWTKSLLTTLADLRYGGVEVAATFRYRELVEQLRHRFNGTNAFHEGVAELQEFMELDDVPSEYLYCANVFMALLTDVDGSLNPSGGVGSLEHFFDRYLPNTSANVGMSALYETLMPPRRPSIVGLPSMGRVSHALGEMLAAGEHKRSSYYLLMEFFKKTLEIPADLTTRERSVAERIQDVVWNYVLDACNLMSSDSRAEQNLRRLASRLGVDCISAEDVTGCSLMMQYGLESPKQDRKHPCLIPNSDITPPRELGSGPELYCELVDHVNRGGALSATGLGTLADRIKTFVGRDTWTATRPLLQVCGFEVESTMSSNELRLVSIEQELVERGNFVSSESEKRIPQDKTLSFDRVMSYTLRKNGRLYTAFIEAQGEGHFDGPGRTHGHLFDPPKQRECDRRKITSFWKYRGELSATQRDRHFMVCLHHKLLSNSKPELNLNARDFLALSELARKEQAWWLYVRDSGSMDMNAVPDGSSPVLLALPASWRNTRLGRVEVFALSADLDL